MSGSGENVNRQDGQGDTPLHHAAAEGDLPRVEQLLAQGASTLLCNQAGAYARDVARAWGHDAVAARLAAEMERERQVVPAAPIPYKSLQEIRAVGAFYGLAAAGLFGQVVALAEKDPEGLRREDLLGRGRDGDTVILRLCQEGQLSLLLKPELWADRLPDLMAVLEAVPKAYGEGLNIASFINRTRQMKLQQSSIVRPAWKDPRPGKGL